MPAITSANAREMAAKSHAAKAERLEQLRTAANPVPPMADNSYIERRLARVREQIERVSAEIDASMRDSKRLKELTDALSRLAELEQKYAMRPGPGTLTNRPAKPSRGTTTIEPVEDSDVPS